MKKVSATITIDVTAWVKGDYDTNELLQYLKCYYSGAVPDGWLHEIEELEATHTLSHVVVVKEAKQKTCKTNQDVVE